MNMIRFGRRRARQTGRRGQPLLLVDEHGTLPAGQTHEAIPDITPRPPQADGPASEARRRFLRNALVIAGAAVAGAIVRDLMTPAQPQTDPAAELARMQAEAQRAAQIELAVHDAAVAQAAQYTDTFRAGAQHGHTIRGVLAMHGTVYNTVDGKKVAIYRNPLFLATPNEDASAPADFMNGAYIGLFGNDNRTGEPIIYPYIWYEGMTFEPDNPGELTSLVDVQVDALSPYQYNLNVVNGQGSPVQRYERDGSPMRLCVPIDGGP